jgi:hypothetical protein
VGPITVNFELWLGLSGAAPSRAQRFLGETSYSAFHEAKEQEESAGKAKLRPLDSEPSRGSALP